MIGSGGDLSSALFLKESTMYLRSCGIDDSTGKNGILFGRAGGDLDNVRVVQGGGGAHKLHILVLAPRVLRRLLDLT